MCFDFDAAMLVTSDEDVDEDKDENEWKEHIATDNRISDADRPCSNVYKGPTPSVRTALLT
jgi:hypothetical protein